MGADTWIRSGIDCRAGEQPRAGKKAADRVAARGDTHLQVEVGSRQQYLTAQRAPVPLSVHQSRQGQRANKLSHRPAAKPATVGAPSLQ